MAIANTEKLTHFKEHRHGSHEDPGLRTLAPVTTCLALAGTDLARSVGMIMPYKALAASFHQSKPSFLPFAGGAVLRTLARWYSIPFRGVTFLV
jgi:hypothetical protein